MKGNLKRAVTLKTNQKNLKKRKENIENDDAKLSKAELFKAPTVEELNQLKETEILFNSNLFRLQTEELIKEVSIKEKRKREINSWLEKFKLFCNNLPEYEDVNLSDFNACLEEVKSVKLKGILKKISKNKPINLKTDQNAPIKFLKPTSVETIGLYPLNATIGPTIQVTLNIVIPKACFHAKDYLNARYLVKRALYLSYLGTHLQANGLVNNVSYTYLHGNKLHPILYIATNQVRRTIFQVLLSPEEGTFKLSRFDDDRSNIRWSYANNIGVTAELKTEIEDCPSPWYNAIVAHDVTLSTRDVWAREALQQLKGVREALLLLSVWLRQRELHLGDALLLGLTATLVQSGRLNKHMSSYQAVRNIWTHLTQNNVTCVVFHCNLATQSLSILHRIQQQAKLALGLLDSADLHAFQTLFMTKMPFSLQYDAIVNIYNSSDLNNVYNRIPDKIKLEYLTFKSPLILNEIIKMLNTGLTDRISCIVPKFTDPPIWDIGESEPARSELFVSLGLRFNVENLYRVVDKGPTAYDPQATSFREFWADKAELRRFKDGSICEAVYWPVKYIRDKRNICKNIIEFVLGDKFMMKDYNIVYDQLDDILKSKLEEQNLKIVAEFDILVKKLRSLKLPLEIASIQGISSAFSYSDPFPPIPQCHLAASTVTYAWGDTALFKNRSTVCETPQLVSPVRAVMQMVAHSKWPAEPGAMTALRTALFLQMSEQLRREGTVSRASPQHLDVAHAGLVMRLTLYHPKEHVERELHCVVLPKLRGALGGFQGLCPSLGPSAALATRWLRSQLLDLPAAVTELLTAAACVRENVALPQRGFLLFLELVSTYAFSSQPLIVDINNELTQTQRDELHDDFTTNRDEFPALCVITPWDLKSKVSALGPTVPHLQRLRLLAAQTLRLVQNGVYDKQLFNATTLFKPNLAGYNVLIHLDELLNARRCEALNAPPQSAQGEYDSNVTSQMPIVDFNPVELYLQQLRDNYSDFALFFHDVHGGNVIAVLWKPNISEKHEFKVSQVAGMKLVQSEQKLQVNLDAIIEDFYILGEGIVKSIQVL